MDDSTLVPYFAADHPDELKQFDFGDDGAPLLDDDLMGSDGQSIPDENVYDAINDETFGADLNDLIADDDLAEFAIRTANLALLDDEPSSSTFEPPDPSQIPMPSIVGADYGRQKTSQPPVPKKTPIESLGDVASSSSSIWASGSFNGIGSLDHQFMGQQLKTESNNQQKIQQPYLHPSADQLLPNFHIEPPSALELIKPLAKSPATRKECENVQKSGGTCPMSAEELERKLFEEAAAAANLQKKMAQHPSLPPQPPSHLNSTELERKMFEEAVAAQQQQQIAATAALQIQQKQAMMAQAMMAAAAMAASAKGTPPAQPAANASTNPAILTQSPHQQFPPPVSGSATPLPPPWYQQLMKTGAMMPPAHQFPGPPPLTTPLGPHMTTQSPAPQMPIGPPSLPPPPPQLLHQWQQQIQQAFAAAAAAGAGMPPPPPPGMPPMMPPQFFLPPPPGMATPQQQHPQMHHHPMAHHIHQQQHGGRDGGGTPLAHHHIGPSSAQMMLSLPAPPVSQPTTMPQLHMVPASLHPRTETRRQKGAALPSGKTIADYALDPYAGLMSTKEREWLIKIQIIQCLGTGDPLEDDFYYTMWKQQNVLVKAPEKQKEAPKYYKFEATYPSTGYTMPSFLGALGKPIHSSSRIPRQIIEIPSENPEDESSSTPANAGKQTAAHRQKRLRALLMKIENAALMLIDCRDIRRKLRFFEDTCITEYIDKREISEREARFAENLAHVEASIFVPDQLPTVMLIQKGRQLVCDWLQFLLSDSGLQQHRPSLLAHMRTVIEGMGRYARKVPDDSLELFATGFCSLFTDINPSTEELFALLNSAKLDSTLIRDSKLVQLTLLSLLAAIIQTTAGNHTTKLFIEQFKHTPIGHLLFEIPEEAQKLDRHDADDLRLFSAEQWAIVNEWLTMATSR